MLCSSCGEDVHPIQTLGSGKDGGSTGRDFTSRCPREECGAKMDPPPQTTVTLSLASELEALKADEADLVANDQRDDDDNACLKDIRRRIRRIEHPPAPRASKPIIPSFTMPGAPVPPVVNPPARHAVEFVREAGDIFDSLRQRLAQIEVERQLLDREARKLTAVLAVADSTE